MRYCVRPSWLHRPTAHALALSLVLALSLCVQLCACAPLADSVELVEGGERIAREPNNTTVSPATLEGDGELWEQIVTLLVIVFMLVAMAKEIAPPDMLMMGCVAFFITTRIITLEEGVEGFANTGMLTVAVLFAVAAGIQATGAVDPLRRLMDRAAVVKGERQRSLPLILFMTTMPISALSAFLNNTPVVAMMIPVLQEFGQRIRVPASKLLIPLSYASILGGTCTLMGTSTNLVVVGLAQQRIPGFAMGIFDIGQIGLPVLFAGLLYIVVFGPRFLPDRGSVTSILQRPREYITVMFVRKADDPEGGSTLGGKTVSNAGLRSLPGLYLVRIERENHHVITAPSPDDILQGGDKLFFAGVVDSVLSLRQIRGLRLAENEEGNVDLYRLEGEAIIVEAVVAPHSALVHRTVKEVKFRSRYDAAIMAVHRHGVRIQQKIGSIVLQPGDTLLMVTKPSFMQQHRLQEHFALISQVDGQRNLRRNKAPLAVFFTVAMIALSVGGVLDLLTAALLAIAGLMITRCLTSSEVRESINLEVLIVIAGAFGVSNALVKSGAAKMLAKALLAAAEPTGLTGLYIVVYLATTLFTASVTNNAAVTIMFPVAYEAALDAKADFTPFLYLLMMGASASFMTPTGYQTNLMVYGPGGYTFLDYVRFGGGLQVVLGVLTVAIVATVQYWWIWFLACLAALIVFLIFTPRSAEASEANAQELAAGEAQAGSPPRPEIMFYQPDMGLSPMEQFDDEMEGEDGHLITLENTFGRRTALTPASGHSSRDTGLHSTV